ncbi:hypothetical protein FB45DRAFT_223433 [Roridomyces roridus]|uniref:Uncharacterized protein n=1 Tax=Roridomyces roridus TaxID=1738132 RepID=A0AAD7BD02_9AGAR|nr:hypothetical protein FB45DRAFT_223433 [Roridomyces roridus]
MSDTKSTRSGDKERGKAREGRRDKDKHEDRRHSDAEENGRGRKDSHSSKARSTEDKASGAPVSVSAPYGPEFLRAIAQGDSVRNSGTFDVITGADAVDFTRKFVLQDEEEVEAVPRPAKSSASLAHTPGTLSFAHNPASRRLQPVVFALPRNVAGGAGRKIVDFWLSWRGKTKPHNLTGVARRAGFLDSEFRRVKETIDGEWRRASRALTGRSAWEEGERQSFPMLVRAPTDPQRPPRLAPLLAASKNAERKREKGADSENPPPTVRSHTDPLPLPRARSGSADNVSVDSVRSIPLLGMVRGVPIGNRVPLRVTNPNDRSSVSSSGVLVSTPARTAIDCLDLDTARAPPKPVKTPRASPLRGSVAFAVPEVERVDADPVPGPSTQERIPSRSEEEQGKERMLIVLLDEKDGEKVEDGTTWHGLERRLSERSRDSSRPRPGKKNGSPWMGRLAELDEDVMYTGARHSEQSDDEDDFSEDDDELDFTDHDRDRPSWARPVRPPPRPSHSPIVTDPRRMPVRRLLSAMGYLTPEAFVPGDRFSPYGSYTPLPTPYNSPSPYAAGAGTPLAGYSSPYVSPYVGSTQMPAGSPYHSPVGQTVYPPTAYTSPYVGPSPAVYASPSPAVYASPGPAPGYASAAPGYGYASPYTSPLPAAYVSPAPAPAAPLGYASPYTQPGYFSPYVGAASPAGSFHHTPLAGHRSPYVDGGQMYSSPYVGTMQQQPY